MAFEPRGVIFLRKPCMGTTLIKQNGDVRELALKERDNETSKCLLKLIQFIESNLIVVHRIAVNQSYMKYRAMRKLKTNYFSLLLFYLLNNLRLYFCFILSSFV